MIEYIPERDKEKVDEILAGSELVKTYTFGRYPYADVHVYKKGRKKYR